MNGPPIMKNKIEKTQWFMWTHSLGETSRKPKSKHHCRYKHKISDNDETFQNLTLKHVHLKDNHLFHLNFQYG